MDLFRILIIDDNKARIQQFESVLSFLEYQVFTVSSLEFATVLHGIKDVQAIFIGGGYKKQAALIRQVLDFKLGLPVVLLIDKGTRLQISSAIQKMVTQCIEWPSVSPVFLAQLEKISTPKEPEQLAIINTAKTGLVGNSQGIRQVKELIVQVAASDATVLVLGESGTGKEVVAQALHRASRRKNKPFVPINCGAIPGELLESELFGHEKGAFTGALTTRKGRFEMAEGGTLFLDEIGDMPMPMQVKLLRVLQEHTFERVGSNQTIACDVRIIAATHRNLEHEIEQKRFREDLFYRLNVFPIEIPALRERAEDIPLLVNDLVARMKTEKRDTVQFTGKALALMMEHPWPGNVRELSNFIERLTILHANSIVDCTDLPDKFQHYVILHDRGIENIEVNETEVDLEIHHTVTDLIPLQIAGQGIDLKGYLSDLEVDLIRQALHESHGVVAHAARRLSMGRTTLVEKMRKYDLSEKS